MHCSRLYMHVCKTENYGEVVKKAEGGHPRTLEVGTENRPGPRSSGLLHTLDLASARNSTVVTAQT